MAITTKTIKILAGLWEDSDPHALLVGVKDGSTILQSSMAISSEVKHKCTTQQSSSIPRYLFKKHEHICLHKDLDMNAHSSIIRNSQKTQDNPNVQPVNR